MLGRRLLIYLFAMFALLLVVGQIAPRGDLPQRRAQPATPGAPDAAPGPSRNLVLRPDGRVFAQVGDAVTLTVPVTAADTVEIDALGLSEYGAPRAAAKMRFVAYPAGSYPITSNDTGATLGTLVIQPAPASPPSGEPASGGRGVPSAA